jgi:hypothetical protein
MWTKFEILITVVMKTSVLWDITSCGLLNVNWRFGVICQPPSLVSKNRPSQKSRRSKRQAELRAALLLFRLEDIGEMYLRNVRWLSTEIIAEHKILNTFQNLLQQVINVDIQDINRGKCNYARGFDSRCGECIFWIYLILPASLGP